MMTEGNKSREEMGLVDLFGVFKNSKKASKKDTNFQPGDIVVHKLTRQKFLVDKIQENGKTAVVETENSKTVHMGVHKLERVEQNHEFE